MEIWIAAAVIAVPFGVWAERRVAGTREKRYARYGSHMFMMLEELDTNTERMEYLMSDEHKYHKSRCDCKLYSLPFKTTTIIDNNFTHTSLFCQPTREFIGKV